MRQHPAPTKEPRRPRSDGRRSVAAILRAADQVLAGNPGAPIAEIASAAHVGRATLHRHFPDRDSLLEELSLWTAGELEQAVERARPATAPPLVALHQATVNVLETKLAWPFAAMRLPPSARAAETHARLRETTDQLFRRAQAEGDLAADADLQWMRRVYYALIHESLQHNPEQDPDQMAGRIVATLLHGFA